MQDLENRLSPLRSWVPFTLRTHDNNYVKRLSQRFIETGKFSPRVPVFSHRNVDIWRVVAISPSYVTGPSTVTVLSDQTCRVKRWLPEAALESLRLRQIELHPLQFRLALSSQVRMTSTCTHSHPQLHSHLYTLPLIPAFFNFNRSSCTRSI